MQRNRLMLHGDESHLYCSRIKTFTKEIESYDIYKGDSIYEDDYKFYAPEKRGLFKWPKDKFEVKAKTNFQLPERIDQESYSLINPDVHIPFNLFWEPRPITGTNPRMMFLQNKDEIEGNHLKVTDKERLEAIRSRPRVILLPAVKVDDIEDDTIRNIIITNMYTSDWKRAAKLAADAVFKDVRPYPICSDLQRPALHNKTNLRPAIERRFRSRARNWDNEQARETVDPTASFWLHKELKEEDIFATEKLVTQGTKDKIKRLIEQDKLRLAYDVTTPDYCGFRPKVSYGVTLEKVDIPVSHPNNSVSHIITRGLAEDYLAQREAAKIRSSIKHGCNITCNNKINKY